MRFAHFFVDRPIFASVLSIVLLIVGSIAYTQLPVAQYPEIAPPTIVVRAAYPGADAETVSATVATPIEQEINGVEGMLYMSSYSSSDGAMSLTITFRLGTDLDQAQVLVQNRVSIAAAAPARRGAAPRHHHRQELARPDDGRAHAVTRQHLRPALRLQLCPLADPGRAAQARRRRRPDHLRRARIFAAHLARSGETVGLRHDCGRCRGVAARAERAGVGRLDRRAADRRKRGVPVHRDHPGTLRRCARLPLRDRQVDRRRTADHARGRRPHRARRQGLHHQFLPERQAGGGACHLPAARHQRARHGQFDHRQDDRARPAIFRRGWVTKSSTIRPSSSRSRSTRSTRRSSRRCFSWSSSSSSSCSHGEWRSCRSLPSRSR